MLNSMAIEGVLGSTRDI